jgi:hypothetical protein
MTPPDGGAVPALFAANPLPMWLIDERATRVLDANDAAVQRYGLSRADALALDPSRLVSPDLAPAFRAWLVEADGSASEAFDQLTGDGDPFAAEVRVVRLEWQGRDARLIVVRDITARVRIEERLRQSQKMEAVGRLAGSIAHDFNNLLTAIGGYADLLLGSLDPDDPAADDAREIRRAVERGAALTRQLLAFSRRQVVQPHVVDLNESVNGMRPLLERLLGERTRLVLGLGGAAGTVRIDPGQLEQVLLNLAINGRDAMPAGGRLLVETAQVELDDQYAAARRDVSPGRYAVLAVSDEGGGLSDEARAHLFEPFFTTKPRGQGTGLGLATVYGIVRQAGGHIDVYSQPDFGTTFRVYLPSLAESATLAEVPPVPVGTPRPMSGRVLVAEDEAVVRRVIVETLSRAGLLVREARDGADALALLERGPLPELLVTDVRMPGMSGPELARAARSRWPGIAVLFVSGHTGADTPADLTAHGGYLLGKPFTTEALLAAVAEALRRARASGAPAPTGGTSGGASEAGDRDLKPRGATV